MRRAAAKVRDRASSAVVSVRTPAGKKGSDHQPEGPDMAEVKAQLRSSANCCLGVMDLGKTDAIAQLGTGCGVSTN